MKPCSAYCKPEEGLHTYLSYGKTPNPLGGTPGLRRPVNGLGNGACLGIGTMIKVIGHVPAAEAPPSPLPDFPYPLLITVMVIA